MTKYPPHIPIKLCLVREMLKASAESGVAVDAILERLGLSQVLEAKASYDEISLIDYFRLQRDIARSVDDLTAKLSQRKLTYRTGQFVVEQMQRATSLQAGLEILCDHFNMMHGDVYNSVRFTSETVSLVVDDSKFPYTFKDNQPLTELVGDCLLIEIHCLLDSLTGGLANEALRRVSVRRDRSGIKEANQIRFWTVPVHYGRNAYELVYELETACRRIEAPELLDLSADGIFTTVIDYLESLSPETEHRHYLTNVQDLIASGNHSQADIAERLGISVATLRRRLQEDGTSFRGLTHKAKCERAEMLLTAGLSVSQVSDQLEYSDIRAFNRAFKNWTGRTPAAFIRESISE